MAEESEITAVTSLDNSTNNNLKRKKLNDSDNEQSNVAAPDSFELDAVDNADDEPSKRPRFDELESENGHQPDEDNGHTEDTTEAEAEVENAETTVDDAADCDESAEEAIPEEENEPQPVPEVDHKDDAQNGNSDEIDAEENIVKTSGDEVQEPGDEVQEPVSEVAAEGDSASAAQHPDSGSKSASKKIEIPNNKVGVLIGKSGETIKYLQINSGAKIQITRDADADRHATTRTVELVGNPESLNKAERLIKDVMAEADAGGSPALVARGLSAALTAGSNEVEIPVPGDKVGLIIGRGGETIRNLQTRSGARIQLIQNIPGEQGKEKKVKITGDRKQVEAAKELIKEVMNQMPGRPSQFSGNNYSQQSYRPRGPGGASQWGDRGPPSQPMPYDYHQRGPAYPSHSQSYPAQSHGNYPHHGPPRSNFNSNWEHRPPTQGPPHGGGYDYYGQGGGHAANAPAPHSSHMPGHSQGNYNHSQPRGADYNHPTPYSQTAPPAQNYGHGYGDPKFNSQAPVQQPYGAQGYAPPQQQGYAPQQQYNRPPSSYGMPSQGAPQSYAPPTANQPADATYQGAPVSAPQPYAQNVQPQQQYAYAPGTTSQPPYGAAPVTNDAYAQPQPAAGYTQPGAQPVPTYGQQAGGYTAAAAPTAGYGQYPQAAQPGYGDQTAAAAAAATGAAPYGYQGQVDPSAYAAGQAYGAAPAPAAQPGYGQPVATQSGYDQLAAQAGAYASAAAAAAPAAAPTAFAPPQMYAAPR